MAEEETYNCDCCGIRTWLPVFVDTNVYYCSKCHGSHYQEILALQKPKKPVMPDVKVGEVFDVYGKKCRIIKSKRCYNNEICFVPQRKGWFGWKNCEIHLSIWTSHKYEFSTLKDALNFLFIYE